MKYTHALNFTSRKKEYLHAFLLRERIKHENDLYSKRVLLNYTEGWMDGQCTLAAARAALKAALKVIVRAAMKVACWTAVSTAARMAVWMVGLLVDCSDVQKAVCILGCNVGCLDGRRVGSAARARILRWYCCCCCLLLLLLLAIHFLWSKKVLS
jgi:hypothetical protein